MTRALRAKVWSRGRNHAKVRVLPGYTRVFPGIPAKYPVFCRFCRFCHQEGTPTRFDFREATGIPYHFLISAGLGFDQPKTPIPVKFERCVSSRLVPLLFLL